MLVMGMAAPSPAAPTELVVTSDTRPKEGRLNDQQTEIFLSKCPPVLTDSLLTLLTFQSTVSGAT